MLTRDYSSISVLLSLHVESIVAVWACTSIQGPFTRWFFFRFNWQMLGTAKAKLTITTDCWVMFVCFTYTCDIYLSVVSPSTACRPTDNCSILRFVKLSNGNNGYGYVVIH